MTIPIQLEWGSAVQLTILHIPHHHHPFSDHPHPILIHSQWKAFKLELGRSCWNRLPPFSSGHKPTSLHQHGAKKDEAHDKRLHTNTLKQLVYAQLLPLLQGHHIYWYTAGDTQYSMYCSILNKVDIELYKMGQLLEEQ